MHQYTPTSPRYKVAALSQGRVLQSAYESEAQDLREKLAQKKAKLKAAEARIRARISVRERKRRTCCLILIGSYIEHVTQIDPDRKARLMRPRFSWGWCSTWPGEDGLNSPSD